MTVRPGTGGTEGSLAVGVRRPFAGAEGGRPAPGVGGESGTRASGAGGDVVAPRWSALADGEAPAVSEAPRGALASPGTASASMKYGATSANPRAAAIACTSREYHRFAARSLWRRNPPWGSVMRSKPVTLAAGTAGGRSGDIAEADRAGAAAGADEAPGCTRSRSSAGTNPRFTSTMLPSANRSGVSTQYPAPRSVTACTSVCESSRKVPVAVTRRYSSAAALIFDH